MSVRTFNDDMQNELLQLVENTRTSEIDIVERIVDFLKDDPYAKDYTTPMQFYEDVIDKYNTSKREINRIFSDVYRIHDEYTKKFSERKDFFRGYSLRTKALCDLVRDGNHVSFQSSNFLSDLHSAKINGLAGQYTADGRWKEILGKDADSISDEEYQVLAIIFASLNNEKDMEDFLRGMMVRDLENDKRLKEGSIDPKIDDNAFSLWHYDQKKLSIILALTIDLFNVQRIAADEIAAIPKEKLGEYGIEATIVQDGIVASMYEKLGLVFRNINLLRTIKNDTYFGNYNLTEAPDSSISYSIFPSHCFKVIIDDNTGRISIAVSQELLNQDYLTEADKDRNIYKTMVDGCCICTEYHITHSVYNMRIGGDASKKIKEFVIDKKLGISTQGGICYSTAKGVVQGKMIAYGIKMAGETIVSVTPPGWIATAVSAIKSVYDKTESNNTKIVAANLLDNGSYAERFQLMVSVIENREGTSVAFAPTKDTQPILYRINLVIWGKNNNLKVDDFDLDSMREIADECFKKEVKEVTMDMVIDDPEATWKFINQIEKLEIKAPKSSDDITQIFFGGSTTEEP